MFFGPKKCKHKWRVIAYDPAFNSTYGDEKNRVYHHVKYLKCKLCDERQFEDGGAGETHKGVNSVKHRWLEQNILMMSASDGEVYDPDYLPVNTGSNWVTFEFQKLTGVQKILKILKEDQEFKKLAEHQMVADAFGELEAVIKMHEGIDKT